MLTLADVMTTELLCLAPESTLRDAVEQLAHRHVSAAPVVTGRGAVVGTLSANDILAFIASTPGVPELREDDPWLEGTPPSDDNAPGSYFADFWEDAGAEVSARILATDGPEWDVLEEHTVAEAMTRRTLRLPPATPLRRAARRMSRSGVHRVLVVHDGALLGIVSTMDIARAFGTRARQAPAPSP